MAERVKTNELASFKNTHWNIGTVGHTDVITGVTGSMSHKAWYWQCDPLQAPILENSVQRDAWKPQRTVLLIPTNKVTLVPDFVPSLEAMRQLPVLALGPPSVSLISQYLISKLNRSALLHPPLSHTHTLPPHRLASEIHPSDHLLQGEELTSGAGCPPTTQKALLSLSCSQLMPELSCYSTLAQPWFPLSMAQKYGIKFQEQILSGWLHLSQHRVTTILFYDCWPLTLPNL